MDQLHRPRALSRMTAVGAAQDARYGRTYCALHSHVEGASCCLPIGFQDPSEASCSHRVLVRPDRKISVYASCDGSLSLRCP